MDKSIIGGVFDHQDHAIRAIQSLRDLGYTNDQISVFAKSDDDIDEIERVTDVTVEDDDSGRGKNAGKGAAIGAGTGGVLGGLVGLIAEIGLLAIPGIGAIAAAGPLAATVLGGAAVGAGGGTIIGALTGAGIPEEHAKQYETYLKNGNIVVLVETDKSRENDVYNTYNSNNTLNRSMYPVGRQDSDVIL